MHEWERQDKLLEKVENLQIANCLEYNVFKYEKQEWDNIPGIVPRYVIYLSKYIEGLSSICNDFNSRETTLSLRDDLVAQLKSTNSELTTF